MTTSKKSSKAKDPARARGDSIQEGGRIGVDAGSSLSFSASPTGTREAVRAASASMGRMRRGETKTLKYTEDERRRSAG